MGLLLKITGKKLEDIGVFLEKAVETVVNGGVIAFPTNSVYGLGCDPTNLSAIEKIYDIKYRDRSKGLLLLVADIEEAEKVAAMYILKLCFIHLMGSLIKLLIYFDTV